MSPPVHSAKAVATAAPTKPNFSGRKINKGSAIKFNALVVNDTLSGVTVLSKPRYAEKPVAENNAGIMDNERYRKYGAAYCIAGAVLDDKTNFKTVRGESTMSNVPMPPNKLDKNKLSQIASCAASVSPDPTAVATSGAVIIGKKATKKYIVKKA
mmetsp:Transcript_30218/g.33517  ORF Transcript_30218/g.33517 Transcript_30218/m.33517 type:complete len:155 (-) Transcript_30218:679-1143(-)